MMKDAIAYAIIVIIMFLVWEPSKVGKIVADVINGYNSTLNFSAKGNTDAKR